MRRNLNRGGVAKRVSQSQLSRDAMAMRENPDTESTRKIVGYVIQGTIFAVITSVVAWLLLSFMLI